MGRGPGSLRDLHNNIPFFFFLTLPSSLLDAISPTRDQRHAPCSGRVGVLTVGPPGKPHVIIHGGSSAGSKAPPGRGWEDAADPPDFNRLSLDSVDLCPSSVLNSLLKPSHVSTSTLSLKRPHICCLGRPCLGRDPQGPSYLL